MAFFIACSLVTVKRVPQSISYKIHVYGTAVITIDTFSSSSRPKSESAGGLHDGFAFYDQNTDRIAFEAHPHSSILNFRNRFPVPYWAYLSMNGTSRRPTKMTSIR